ncbi:hypothetical protein G887_03084, partial [Escherichia coli KOEGE 56 (169a)]
QLAEISSMTESIGGKTALDWAMKQDFRCGCWLTEKPETAMKAITRNLDREIWRDLMQRSGMHPQPPHNPEYLTFSTTSYRDVSSAGWTVCAKTTAVVSGICTP